MPWVTNLTNISWVGWFLYILVSKTQGFMCPHACMIHSHLDVVSELLVGPDMWQNRIEFQTCNKQQLNKLLQSKLVWIFMSIPSWEFTIYKLQITISYYFQIFMCIYGWSMTFGSFSPTVVKIPSRCACGELSNLFAQLAPRVGERRDLGGGGQQVIRLTSPTRLSSLLSRAKAEDFSGSWLTFQLVSTRSHDVTSMKCQCDHRNNIPRSVITMMFLRTASWVFYRVAMKGGRGQLRIFSARFP